MWSAPIQSQYVAFMSVAIGTLQEIVVLTESDVDRVRGNLANELWHRGYYSHRSIGNRLMTSAIQEFQAE